jgi:hypothetical protein
MQSPSLYQETAGSPSSRFESSLLNKKEKRKTEKPAEEAPMVIVVHSLICPLVLQSSLLNKKKNLHKGFHCFCDKLPAVCDLLR